MRAVRVIFRRVCSLVECGADLNVVLISETLEFRRRVGERGGSQPILWLGICHCQLKTGRCVIAHISRKILEIGYTDPGRSTCYNVYALMNDRRYGSWLLQPSDALITSTLQNNIIYTGYKTLRFHRFSSDSYHQLQWRWRQRVNRLSLSPAFTSVIFTMDNNLFIVFYWKVFLKLRTYLHYTFS